MSQSLKVRVWTEDLVIPTYLPAPPDRNPMFLEKRVYQGSSGKVYPLPFTDRIAERRVNRRWKAVWLENDYLRVLVLPELGGRIHALQDRTTGHDLIYRQPVIKPALVGLAGPWISGGIEFNWPQHHRPATFLPADFHVQEHSDGSRTVWCSDHDPLTRMKGMHGVCLHPGTAWLELKVRVCNRTPLVQTFLWWANVAVRVHDGYQSFFPPDVSAVADHARRATSAYPLAQGFYYGVNYGRRARTGSRFSDLESGVPSRAPNDLSWYANIPVPTSYMCLGSQQDFFGGYDHPAQAGIIHVADHHIAPGKKQWTWGNHPFGHAWDRNLTVADERGEFPPYIELMAGVYTDNQPDFSFLQPGETKTWSQYWYPIHKIGPAQHANLHAAVSLGLVRPGAFRVGVAVTSLCPHAQISLSGRGKTLFNWKRHLAPDQPLVEVVNAGRGLTDADLCLRVIDRAGHELISYQPQRRADHSLPASATEPPPPEAIASTDELYITGLHLEQYRHATRSPVPYWEEALQRDPLDARCNNAMGLWRLRRGEFDAAEAHFRKAIERLTRRNPNPYDGEPYYHLGLCLRHQLDSVTRSLRRRSHFEAAYAAFSKATWNQAWAGAGHHALAELDCRRGNWAAALQHLNRSLRCDADNLRARDLKAIVLRKLADEAEQAEAKCKLLSKADALLRETLALDPLDWWARHLAGEPLTCDSQLLLDLAHDCARAGLYDEAIDLLRVRAPINSGSQRNKNTTAPAVSNRNDSGSENDSALPDRNWGAAPLVHYTLGWLHQKRGDDKAAREHFRCAAAWPPDYCFPARLEEIAILEAARRANPKDARAPYYLGNLLYDRRRHDEAIRLWERSGKLVPAFSITWRNLGIGYFNIRHQPAKARAAYERAFHANPKDARLLYERDQLWKRLGEPPAKRLRELEAHLDLVQQRDDLSVELCALYNQTGQHEKALSLLRHRHFQPWEGGEGQVLGQHVRTHLALGRKLLAQNEAFCHRTAHRKKRAKESEGQTGGDVTMYAAEARAHFEAALEAPPNLGEAKHLLANQSDIHYWLGCALHAQGRVRLARHHWRLAATFKGDFQETSVRAFSEMTYYSALACRRLGRRAQAENRLLGLLAYAQNLRRTAARIDYFATSLPTLLLFDDDLQFRRETTALFLEAQASHGLGRARTARRLLARVLERDPNHALAADLVAEGAMRSPAGTRKDVL